MLLKKFGIGFFENMPGSEISLDVMTHRRCEIPGMLINLGLLGDMFVSLETAKFYYLVCHALLN